jgi:hypothetical protein
MSPVRLDELNPETREKVLQQIGETDSGPKARRDTTVGLDPEASAVVYPCVSCMSSVFFGLQGFWTNCS